MDVKERGVRKGAAEKVSRKEGVAEKGGKTQRKNRL